MKQVRVWERKYKIEAVETGYVSLYLDGRCKISREVIEACLEYLWHTEAYPHFSGHTILHPTQ